MSKNKEIKDALVFRTMMYADDYAASCQHYTFLLEREADVPTLSNAREGIRASRERLETWIRARAIMSLPDYDK